MLASPPIRAYYFLKLMKYRRITVEKYKGVVDSVLPITDSPIPIIGVNESGKSSALEAGAHFDWRNDDIISKKEWKFLNRYKPKENRFRVTAQIEITQAELDELLEPYFGEEVDESTPPQPTPATIPDPAAGSEGVEEAVEETAEAEEPEEEIPDIKIKNGTITLTRIFDSSGAATKHYEFNDIDGKALDNIGRDLIKQLPRIYYIGDFLEDHIPNEIEFPAEYAAGQKVTLTEHQKIIEGAFNNADISLKDCLNHEDEDTRNTWVASVSATMTDKIIDDWNKMQLSAGELDVDKPSDVTINLILSENKQKITIKVMEQFKQGDKEFPEISTPLNERSLGFRWFFNFSAMKCFAAMEQEQFIYLFDEPGSFLHNSAQKILLQALIDLAKQHPVIYATHSEFLLDPEQVNVNDIRVVQKEMHEIKLIPLSNTKTKKHEGALSTLNHALRLRTPLETVMKKKVIVTEGITDFYFWQPIIDTVYLPGYGAGNNKYLLSLAIGASQRYVGLFDGDDAGDKAIVQYTGYFGDDEANNWKQYKNSAGKPVVLEKLLSAPDIKRLKKITSMQNTKQAITTLFFLGKADEFWKGIDKVTKNNVKTNVEVLVEHLKLSAGNIKYGFASGSKQA
jgi:AAA ATPase domain